MSKYAQERMQSKREKKQKPDSTHYFEKQKQKQKKKLEENSKKKRKKKKNIRENCILFKQTKTLSSFFFFTCNAGYESAQTKT